MTEAASDGMEMAALGVSDQGRVRSNNEDNLAACNLSTGEVYRGPFDCAFPLGQPGALLMVADGMGGQACGEMASLLCVEETPKRLCRGVESVPSGDQAGVARALRKAVEAANGVIFRKARSHPEYRGMGTTATAVVVSGAALFVAQVGDSRAYLIRDRRMTLLTRDQTFLNYLVDLGADPPEDPENDPRKSILIQAVGTGETVDVKLTRGVLAGGDSVLVCSDGLYNQVKPAEMLNIIGEAGSLADKCSALIEAANASGGSDNVTVILAEFTGPRPSKPLPVEVAEFEAEDLAARR